MIKYILSAAMLVAMVVAMPATARAERMAAIELMEVGDMQGVVVTTSESTVHVSGGNGLTMLVYNVAGGAPVMKVKIDSPEKRIELNLPKGIYIVQVGKVVRKIVIK